MPHCVLTSIRPLSDLSHRHEVPLPLLQPPGHRVPRRQPLLHRRRGHGGGGRGEQDLALRPQEAHLGDPTRGGQVSLGNAFYFCNTVCEVARKILYLPASFKTSNLQILKETKTLHTHTPQFPHFTPNTGPTLFASPWPLPRRAPSSWRPPRRGRSWSSAWSARPSSTP